MRRQGAGPRRKVSFSGRREHPSLARASSGLGPSHVCTWTQQPLRSARPGCGFPLSGRNTGSVSWGQGLWFPVAEPGPGREATNEVCVSERQAGSAPDEPVYSGTAEPSLPGWVQVHPGLAPPRQTSLPAASQPCSGLSSCRARSPTFVIYRPACLLWVWGVFSSPDNGGDNCGGTVFSKWNYKPLKICPSALKKKM